MSRLTAIAPPTARAMGQLPVTTRAAPARVVVAPATVAAAEVVAVGKVPALRVIAVPILMAFFQVAYA